MREQKKDFCHSVSSSSTIGKRGETYHHNSHCNLGLGYVSLGGKHMPLFYVLLCHHDICCAAGDWIYSVDISTMCVCSNWGLQFTGQTCSGAMKKDQFINFL